MQALFPAYWETNLGNQENLFVCLSVCLPLSLHLFCLSLMYVWALGIQTQVFMLA